MAQLSIWGGRVKTDQDDARLRDALRDLDHWRDRAHTAEQEVADLAESLADRGDDIEGLQADLTRAAKEIDRLKATALPPPMDGRPIEPTTDPVQALIGEALDMEIGGAEK